MTYSLDFRERVVRFVAEGGRKSEALRVFGINHQTLYNWLKAEDLRPKRHGPRHRKLDRVALAAHVRDYPDALLRERAVHFGVRINAIWYALKQMKVSKKNDEIS